MYVVIFIYFSVEFEQKNTQPPFPAFPPLLPYSIRLRQHHNVYERN